MDTLIKADIFFFISSIAVIILTIGLTVGIYYVVRGIKKFEEHTERIEQSLQKRSEDVKDITDDVKGMASDIKESFVYNLLFKKSKKKSNKK